MQEMNGQIALVTGAGRGIGSAIAKSLAKEGATVIVNYAGNAQAAQDTVDSILKNGGSAEKYQCDGGQGIHRPLMDQVLSCHSLLHGIIPQCQSP